MSGTVIDDKDNRSISFKEQVGLDEMGKAMKHFGNAFKLLAKREATYHDFTDWLITTDFVEVGMSSEEVNNLMKGAGK